MTTDLTTCIAATPEASATNRNAALASMETAIMRLSSDAATDEDFLTVQHTLAGLKQIVADYAGHAAEASLAYLERRGTVQTETERYYVGVKRTTKCRDTRAAIEAILNATGGDLDTLCGLLASQPLKHGGCRTVLGDEWDRYFETIETPDVATGKPKKEVKRVDPRFLPQSREDGE